MMSTPQDNRAGRHTVRSQPHVAEYIRRLQIMIVTESQVTLAKPHVTLAEFPTSTL